MPDIAWSSRGMAFPAVPNLVGILAEDTSPDTAAVTGWTGPGAMLAAFCEVQLPAVVAVMATTAEQTAAVVRAVRAGNYGAAVPVLIVIADKVATMIASSALRAGASAWAFRDDTAMLATQLVSLVSTGRAVRRLYQGASTDSLTGAATRAFFLDTLASEMARARRHGLPLSVAVLDVDGLKRINDTAGHAVGDTVLRAVAAVARTTIRFSDEFGRLGGDEFGWILVGTDAAQAEEAIARFRAMVSADGIASVSIGIASMIDGRSPLDLLAAADRDLYRRRRIDGRWRDDAGPAGGRSGSGRIA